MTPTAQLERPAPLRTLDEIAEQLESVLARSPADETEIVWLEAVRGDGRRRGERVEARATPERTILVRVLDHGRVGSYRTGTDGASELDQAVRLAVAQARTREPLAGLPHLPADDAAADGGGELYDRDIGALGADGAQRLLRGLDAARETLLLHWADIRAVVFNSRGARRRAAATAVAFEARCGRRPGAGRATDACRRLADLDPQRILERARRRDAAAAPAEPSPAAVIVLSPEATISLVDMLNQESFSAKAYHDGTSFLREHLGVQVFDRRVNLRDDGTDPTGIPFPFDLEGTAKRPVDLIRDGAPKTPTLDQRQAAVLGLPPTAHAIGGNDARAQNLFLRPGESSEDELLGLADGGIWVGWLDHLECREPNRVAFRCRARGVRRIEDGALGAPLPDLFWEDSLLRALSSLLGLGRETSRRLTPDALGGICCPAVAVSGVEGLEAS